MNFFETTYNENYNKMFCIARKMIGDEDVVHDIIQEIFVYYYEKTKSGIKPSQPQNWLIKATVNKSIDYLNRRKKHLELSSVTHMEAEKEDGIELQQKQQMLRNALEKLNEHEMKLAVLYSEGYSYKEIAELTGINYTSVGKMLSRTLQKLKEILKKMNYEMH